MASVRITELTSSGPLTGSEVLPIVQGNETVKVTVQEIANLAGGGLAGTQYLYVAGEGNPLENGVELQTAYDTLKTMVPSANNILTLVVAPGEYKFPSTFIMDTKYINLVSLTGNSDVIFDIDIVDPFVVSGYNITNVSYCLSVEDDFIFVKGVRGKLRQSIQFNNYWGEGTDYILPINVNSNLSQSTLENCIGGWFSFGGDFTFYANPPIVTSTFINCKSGWYSFGSAATGSTAAGTFINCQSSGWSFGQQGIASGYFENCKGTASFGREGEAAGTFINCTDNGSGFGRIASGIFTNCVGSNASFGGFGGGVLTGKLFYCRLRTGLFQTVSSGGRTYYCVDGNGDPNNQ